MAMNPPAGYMGAIDLQRDYINQIRTNRGQGVPVTATTGTVPAGGNTSAPAASDSNIVWSWGVIASVVALVYIWLRGQEA